jgi:hypothetical protein
MLNAVAVFAVCLTFSTLAQAQATRTWVSGVGDDANPCSRTAPCKTFAGAISKTAAKGEINVLDPGGFGGVTITKSITIVSEFTEAGVLVSGTNAIIINALSTDVVTLSGLDICGVGTGLDGIKIIQAKTVNVDRCTIYGFGGSPGRGIDDTRTTGGQLFVHDTIIRNNAGSGVVILPSSGTTSIHATLDNVRLEGHTLAGLSASNGSRVTVRNSVASGNALAGFFAEGSGGAGNSELNLESCIASNNGTGLSVNSGTTVRISNVHVTDNGTGVANAGTIASHGNNRIGGNTLGNTLTGTLTPITVQ